MIDRRTIRVLTTYSKTFFFIDKGTQRGATHDIFIALENELNKQLAKDKKLKQPPEAAYRFCAGQSGQSLYRA